ncbi:GAP family protein [Oerskovia flava]|uniref:GAP family protein n=1 Tax=Oerskovia flava TaxID=2986422 RepID=UPI002240A43C|nr:GAP family protein [Oerskovia sp. JB1-3-2]
MGALVLELLPLGLGIVMSPLAIMALVAVLLSQRARTNGVLFLVGWVVGLALVLALSFVLLDALEVHERRTPPLWVPVIRLLLGAGLLYATVFVYRRGSSRKQQMAAAGSPREVAAAAPQLPGWLQAVDTFTPGRSFLLGLGIFALNPVDVSFAFLAALEIRLAEVPTTAAVGSLVVFGLAGTLPIAVPVCWRLAAGPRAEPSLDHVRRWIAAHTSVLNAALLLFIAVLQIQKGVSALVGT